MAIEQHTSIVYPHFTHLPAGNLRRSHPRFTRWTPAKPATRVLPATGYTDHGLESGGEAQNPTIAQTPLLNGNQ